MFTLTFWRAAGERALRAAAYSLIGVIGVGGIGFGDIDWIEALSVAGVAGVLSILVSLTVNGITGSGPAVTSAEQTIAPNESVVVD